MAAPVKSNYENKRPIINTTGLITNAVAGTALGAILASKPFNGLDVNAVVTGEMRDGFIKQVANEEKKTELNTAFEAFDSAFAPFRKAADDLLKKLKPAEAKEEISVTGDAIKEAAKGLKDIPEEFKALTETLEGAKSYAEKEIKNIGLKAKSLEPAIANAGEAVKKYIDTLKPNRLKSALLFTFVGALVSVIFDLIAATARHSKSQK